MDRQLLNAIVDKYNKNGKIEAIKRFREVTQCGLKDAKDAVEHLADHGVLPPQPLIMDGQERFNKTFKKFDIHNLVSDQVCAEGLAKLLTYCHKRNLSLYGSFDYFTFRGWWNEEGNAHVDWLLNHGYIELRVEGHMFKLGGTCELGIGKYTYKLTFIPISVDERAWVAAFVNIKTGRAWHDAVRISETELNQDAITYDTFIKVVGGGVVPSGYIKQAMDTWREGE